MLHFWHRHVLLKTLVYRGGDICLQWFMCVVQWRWVVLTLDWVSEYVKPLLRQMLMGFFILHDRLTVQTFCCDRNILRKVTSDWSTVCICSRCALKSVPFFYRQRAAGSLGNKLSREPCNSEWGEVQPWGLEYHLFLYAGDLPEHQPSCVSAEVQVASYRFLIFLPHKYIFSMFLVMASS